MGRAYDGGLTSETLSLMKQTTVDANRQLVDKIKASNLYRSYEKAFQAVTGVPLVLQPANGSAEFTPDEHACQNEFCLLLNKERKCPACTHTHASLMRESRNRVGSEVCFAGFEETAVPVKFGDKAVAYLRTGQVLHQRPELQDLNGLVRRLVKEGYDDERIQELHEAYLKTKVVPEKDYQQMVTLLAIFSLQLSSLINQLVLAKNDEEPPVVARAKTYIRERLTERLSLEEVAAAVGVSSFYFCKLFKQTTGMTFTEYVNRKRVECAKQALLKPYARVTEVAFAVGYQSLSQFNRSFLKYAGQSPTQFRKQMQQASRRGGEVLAS